MIPSYLRVRSSIYGTAESQQEQRRLIRCDTLHEVAAGSVPDYADDIAAEIVVQAVVDAQSRLEQVMDGYRLADGGHAVRLRLELRISAD